MLRQQSLPKFSLGSALGQGWQRFWSRPFYISGLSLVVLLITFSQGFKSKVGF